jgi:hypothetical protein
VTLGIGSPHLLGPATHEEVSAVVSGSFLMALAGYWYGTVIRRKPCKATAGAGDDDVFDAIYLLGGATKCPSFRVAGSCLLAKLACFFGRGESSVCRWTSVKVASLGVVFGLGQKLDKALASAGDVDALGHRLSPWRCRIQALLLQNLES